MTWIDFKKLKQSLDFRAVLKLYGVELKAGGRDRFQGPCPLPTHQGREKSRSFSAQLDRGIWQCFGCRAKGNILDLAILMEGLDPSNNADVRTVALKLHERFQIDAGRKPPPTSNPSADVQSPPNPTLGNVLINPPLDFELKDLDPEHPYLKERGFTDETIAHFGLGFCSRRLMKGRVAIPLHDSHGKLVGYAGRITQDDEIDDRNPKYLFPGTREHKGKTLEFRKSLFLYNGWRVERGAKDLVVVEGFPATWWLWQHGYTNVVGLMGSDCSDEQARLIVALTALESRVWCFPDGGDAGRRCAASLLYGIAPYRWMHWVTLPEGRQPTDCSGVELVSLLTPGAKSAII